MLLAKFAKIRCTQKLVFYKIFKEETTHSSKNTNCQKLYRSARCSNGKSDLFDREFFEADCAEVGSSVAVRQCTIATGLHRWQSWKVFRPPSNHERLRHSYDDWQKAFTELKPHNIN